jgi:hypothetical protein
MNKLKSYFLKEKLRKHCKIIDILLPKCNWPIAACLASAKSQSSDL